MYSKLFIFGSLLLFCLMIGRVVQLGITKTEIHEAQRGTIYSANGDVLAQNVASYTLIAFLDPKRTTNPKKPHHVVNKEETAEKLAPILGMEKDEILHYLNKEGLYQTEFGLKGRTK